MKKVRGQPAGFRLVHDRGQEEDDWKVSVGAVHEHRPDQARRSGRDEDSPEVADEYLGFRLARDKEIT
jgi:hypothetical protein